MTAFTPTKHEADRLAKGLAVVRVEFAARRGVCSSLPDDPYGPDTDKQTTTLVRLWSVDAATLIGMGFQIGDSVDHVHLARWWSEQNPDHPYDSNPWVFRIEVEA